MSKKAAGGQATKSASASAASPVQAAPVFLPPFKPRPKLFVALLCVLVVWVGVLLTLYFTMVYPQRGKQPVPLVPAPTTQDPM